MLNGKGWRMHFTAMTGNQNSSSWVWTTCSDIFEHFAGISLSHIPAKKTRDNRKFSSKIPRERKNLMRKRYIILRDMTISISEHWSLMQLHVKVSFEVGLSFVRPSLISTPEFNSEIFFKKIFNSYISSLNFTWICIYYLPERFGVFIFFLLLIPV